MAATQPTAPPSVSPAEPALAPEVKAKPVGPAPTPRPLQSAEVAKAAAKSGQGSVKPPSGVVKSLGLSNKEP